MDTFRFSERCFFCPADIMLLMLAALLKQTNALHCVDLCGVVCKCVMMLLVLPSLLATAVLHTLHLAALHFNLVRPTLSFSRQPHDIMI